MCIRVTGSLLVQFIDLGQFITEPQKITTLTTAQETIRIIHHCHAEGLVKTLIWKAKHLNYTHLVRPNVPNPYSTRRGNSM